MLYEEGVKFVRNSLSEDEGSVAQEGFGDGYDNENLAEFCCMIFAKCWNSLGDCFRYLLFSQCCRKPRIMYRSIEEEDTCSRLKRLFCCGRR